MDDESQSISRARASEKWKNLYIDSKNGHKVRFIDRAKTQEEVYNIMAKVDCGIFPSRAEGWNLELLELCLAANQ